MEPVCNECAQELERREPVVMRARVLRVNCCRSEERRVGKECRL